MSRINFDLTRIKAFIFDVDGVLSPSTISMHPSGEPMRMINIKDGYAIQLAVKLGFEVAIITGAVSQAVRVRFDGLGVPHIYLGAKIKTEQFRHWMQQTGIAPEQVMYMGDDIPDYDVMKMVALPVAPIDAAPEIKEIATYISPYKGGEGCARDVIEQVMKAQDRWMVSEAFGW